MTTIEFDDPKNGNAPLIAYLEYRVLFSLSFIISKGKIKGLDKKINYSTFISSTL